MPLRLPTLRSVTERYAERSAFAQQRARAAFTVYSTAIVAVAFMAVHDVVFGDRLWWLHVAHDALIIGTLASGIYFVWKGRDDRAAMVVPALTVVFAGATLMDALGPHPEVFYVGWVRWFAVFIAGTIVVGTPRSAIAVTLIAIGWINAYYWLFGRASGSPIALKSTIETSIAAALVGTLSHVAITMAQRALALAESQLEAKKRLADELEVRVQERTRDLGFALTERDTVLENLAEGLVAVDAEGRVRVANPALGRLLGLSEELTGREAAAVLPAALLELVAKAPVVGDIPLGEERTARVAVSPLGPERGVVALVRDVTLEREIDRMKTDFTSTVSHELRTPLTSVLGFAKIIKSRFDAQVVPKLPAGDAKLDKAVGQIRGNVDIIVAEGERLTTLINEVLDISKMEAGRVEWRKDPYEPHKLVERAVAACSSLFHEGGPELRTGLEEGLPTLVGDFDRLLQVIVNLISNGAKFTTEGSVTVSARRTDAGVELAVTDTGPGIERSKHALVFEKFKQVTEAQDGKPKGTGLGLPISRQIVRAHGGELRLESDVGKGSRFFFVLPLEAVAAPPSTRVVAAPQAS